MAKRKSSDGNEFTGAHEEIASSVGDFDFNDPSLLEEEVDQVNADVDADEFPPPPPDGIYKVNWDFSESDPEKQFSLRKDSKGKAFGMTKLVGTIIDAKDQNTPERLWLNRKVFSMVNTIVFQSGASGFGDWLKSVGRKNVVQAVEQARNKAEQLNLYRKGAEDAIVEGAQGWVAICWEGSYKLENDALGGTSYIRPKGKYANGEKIAKDHPVQKFTNMKAFPTNDKGERVPKVIVVDPEDGNEYEVLAQLTVKTYIPLREGQQSE